LIFSPNWIIGIPPKTFWISAYPAFIIAPFSKSAITRLERIFLTQVEAWERWLGGFAVRLTEALPPKAAPYVHATGVVNKNPREKDFRLVTAADKCAPKKLRQNPRVDLSIGGAPEDVAPYEHAIGMVNKAAYLRSGKSSPCQGEPDCV